MHLLKLIAILQQLQQPPPLLQLQQPPPLLQLQQPPQLQVKILHPTNMLTEYQGGHSI